jgi:hypothetical protein
MTIYGRFHDVVTIKRMATMEDVETFEERPLDAQDLEALENGAYVVVVQDDGKERLHHQAFLRATNGAVEIGEAIDALVAAQDAVLREIASAPPRPLLTHVIDQSGQPYGSERRCCNRCGQMVVPGMIVVDSVAEWSDLPPERRCDRSQTKETA